MKNFIFKSSKREQTDLYKILTLIEISLAEQRHQRVDLQKIIRLLQLDKKPIPELTEAETLGFSDTELGE